MNKSFRCCILALAAALGWCAMAGTSPVIYGFTPASGGPGTQVTIYGTGLYPAYAVYFGTDASASAQIVGQSDSQVVVIVPANAVSAPIYLVSDRSAISSQTFYLSPRIDSFSPSRGNVGTQVTIEGSGFYDPSRKVYLYFNGVKAQGSVTADTQITAFVPAGASTGFITVTNSYGGGTSSAYFYLNPTITQFTNRIATGQTLNIYGTSFLGVSSVSLAGSPLSFSVLSGTNIQAVIPATAVDGPLAVTSPGGSYITPTNLLIVPTINGFSPPGGGAGTVVTITGTGLAKATQVSFGSLASPAITNINSMTVNAVVPLGFKSAPITLATANGTNTTTTLFYAPPFIDSFSPLSGSPGTTLTLLGKNFDSASQVLLGSASLPGFQVISSTQIQVAAPSSLVTGKFQVTTPGGTATSTSSFTVLGPQPTIDSFSPSFGPVGTTVTLIGSNLGSATSVSFGAVAATFQVSGANLLATVPNGAVAAPIIVKNPYGTATSGQSFVVGTSSDLRMQLSPSLAQGIAYAPLSFNFQVNNRGPLTASNVVITVGFSSALKFVSASGTSDLDHVGNTVTYRYGALANGGTVSGSLVVQAGQPATVSVSAAASSATPIPSGGLNQATVNVGISLPTLQLLSIDPQDILLQWPSPASTYRLESLGTLTSTNWSVVTNAPVDDGYTKQLLLPLSGQRSFFRLRYPGLP